MKILPLYCRSRKLPEPTGIWRVDPVSDHARAAF
jgi:hypothetical protein